MILADSLQEELEEGEEKFCPDCGRTLPADVTYCPVCGVLAEIRQIQPETVKSRLLRVGRAMVFIAGLIGLISGVLNFGSSYTVALYSAEGGPAYSYLALMFFIVAVLSFVGSACGWAASLNRWRKGCMKWTVAQIALLAFVGFFNLIVGTMFWGMAEFGYSFYWATGFLTVILSVPSLILTAFV
jgi:hypothetical protein